MCATDEHDAHATMRDPSRHARIVRAAAHVHVHVPVLHALTFILEHRRCDIFKPMEHCLFGTTQHFGGACETNNSGFQIFSLAHMYMHMHRNMHMSNTWNSDTTCTGTRHGQTHTRQHHKHMTQARCRTATSQAHMLYTIHDIHALTLT